MRSKVRAAAIAAVLAVCMITGASSAVGHSFLATTRPVEGARLAAPPREVALQLSEPVERNSAKIQVTDGDGTPVDVGQLDFGSDGAVVRLPLVSPQAELYRVSWHVVSAVDGHESAGEFAFVVGNDASVAGSTASSGQGQETPSHVTAATWLLLAGWSVAFGAAVLAQRSAGIAFPGRPRTWVRAGTLVALGGLAVRAGATSGGRASSVVLLAGGALVAALMVASSGWRWASLAALAGFAAIWPGRGHAATSVVGWVLDSVHLLAAGLWIGGLTVVMASLGTAARAGRAREAMPLVRVYAGVAWRAVIVLVVTGVVLGWSLVPSVGSLLTDDYGRLLSLKVALVSVAVAAAVIARRRLAGSEVDRLRRTLRPEYASLAVAVLVAAILVDTAPRPPTVETLLGPPPIEGAVARAAGMAGQITLDVQAGDGRLDVNARGPSGRVDLTLAAVLPDGTELDLHPRRCGDACATMQLELPPGDTLLLATAAAEVWTGGSTSLELNWPPTEEDPGLFDRMRQTMLAVDSVDVVEEDGAYPEEGTAGTTMTGARLVELMPWAGGGVTDVRPVEGDQGRFTFYLPGSHMWFDVTVDRQDRLQTMRLVNPGHDIRYRFRYPADPVSSSSIDQ